MIKYWSLVARRCDWTIGRWMGGVITCPAMTYRRIYFRNQKQSVADCGKHGAKS